jgi:hypothetical protein
MERDYENVDSTMIVLSTTIVLLTILRLRLRKMPIWRKGKMEFQGLAGIGLQMGWNEIRYRGRLKAQCIRMGAR